MRNPLQFPDFLQRLADMADTLQRRLQNQMHSDGCLADARKRDSSTCCIAAKGGVDPKLTKAFKEVVEGASKLGVEIRQWSGHTQSNLDKMTTARKAEIMLRFCQDLPLSDRKALYTELRTAELARPDGLGIDITDKFEGARG